MRESIHPAGVGDRGATCALPLRMSRKDGTSCALPSRVSRTTALRVPPDVANDGTACATRATGCR